MKREREAALGARVVRTVLCADRANTASTLTQHASNGLRSCFDIWHFLWPSFRTEDCADHFAGARRLLRALTLLALPAFAGTTGRTLPVHVEESHAGAFYHLVETLPSQEKFTLVLFDAHCDANGIANSDVIRRDIRRGPTVESRNTMLKRWREEGRVQCFNWLEPLMPAPISDVIWVPAMKLSEDEARRLESEAHEYLDAHQEALPREAGPLSARYRVMDFATFQRESAKWPESKALAASVDLDFFAKTADEMLTREVDEVFAGLLRLRGLKDVSVAISSPYLRDAQQAEKLTVLALDTLWRVPQAEVRFEPFARTGPDRSLMARLLERQGKQLPALDLTKAGAELRTLLLNHWNPRACVFEPEKGTQLFEVWGTHPFLPQIKVPGALRRPDNTWSTSADIEYFLRLFPEPVGARVRWFARRAREDEYRIGADFGFSSQAPRWISHERVLLAEGPAMRELTQKQLGPWLDPELHCGTLEIEAEVIRDGEIWRSPPKVVCVSAAGTRGARAAWSEQFGLPYIFDSRLLQRGRLRGPETRWGADCANFITLGLRAEGYDVPWGSPRDVVPHMRPLESLPADGQPVLLHFGSHMAALWEDCAPLGTLDANDLCVHQLEGRPEILTFAALSANRPAPQVMGLRPPGEPLRLVFAGDVMLGRGVAATLEKSNPLAALKPFLSGADLVVGNLECVMTSEAALPESKPGGMKLIAPPNAADALKDAGFTAMSVANNHTLDLGPEGREQTVHELERAGLKAVQGEPVIVDLKTGYRVALLSWDDSLEPDIEPLLRQIHQMRWKLYTVIVMIHWGAEHSSSVTERQQMLARRLADAGADIIVGSGPHVVQSLERENGLVAYSLGNTVFDGAGPDAEWSRGALLEVTLQWNEGRPKIMRARLLPTAFDREGRVRLE